MATRTCPGAAGVSGRAVWACFGVARTLEMSVRDPPKQCYLPHWSHLALEMAGRACLGAAGVSGRVVWACFGVARALKMAAPVQPLGPRNGRLGLPRFWWSAQPNRLGPFRRCQSAQNGCSEPPVKLPPASLPSGREVHGQAKTVLVTAPEPLGPRNGQS